MAGERAFLDRVYDLKDKAETLDIYKDWAETYEDDVVGNGYVTPARTAAAMANAVADKDAPLLDISCGTGLSGVALHEAGFSTVDGTDFSEEMIAIAATKGIYRQLLPGDLTRPLPGGPDDYANYAAIGVFSPGHGMPDAIPAVVARMRPRGCFGFSLNEHTLKDPEYMEVVGRLVEAGETELVFDEYGDHLTGLGSKSRIVVLRKI